MKFFVIIVRITCLIFFTIGCIAISYSQDRSIISSVNHKSDQKLNNEKVRWERSRINSRLIDRNGQIYDGQLLFISDSVIYQLAGDAVYQPEMTRTSTLKFKVDDIQQIHLFRKGQVGNGLIKSFVLGSIGTLALTFLTEESAWGRGFNLLGATIWVMPPSLLAGIIAGSGRKVDIVLDRKLGNNSLETMLPSINKYTLFPEILPVELANLQVVPVAHLALDKADRATMEDQQSKNRARIKVPVIKTYNEFNSPDYISKYHFTIGPGSTVQIMDRIYEQSMSEQNYVPLVLNEPFLLNNLWLTFGFSYRMAKQMRLSLQFKPRFSYGNCYYQKHLDNDFYVVSSRSIFGNTIALNGEYILKPVNRLLFSRFEVLFSGGVVSNTLRIDQNISLAEMSNNMSAIYDSFNSNFNKILWGINGAMEMDYYFTRNFSLYMKTVATYLPNYSLPALTISSDYLNRTQTLQQNRVNNSILDLSFGLQVHF